MSRTNTIVIIMVEMDMSITVIMGIIMGIVMDIITINAIHLHLLRKLHLQVFLLELPSLALPLQLTKIRMKAITTTTIIRPIKRITKGIIDSNPFSHIISIHLFRFHQVYMIDNKSNIYTLLIH